MESANENIIQTLQAATTSSYEDVAIFTVVVYDLILTSPDMIRTIWRNKLTGAKLFFLLNQFSFIATYASVLSFDLSSKLDDRSCIRLATTNNVLVTLHELVISAVQILRVYAISNRMWQFALLVGILNIFPYILVIYDSARSTIFAAKPPSLLDCDVYRNMSSSTWSRMLIAERVCLIGGDAIVVCVTIYHTYWTVKVSREAGMRAKFSSTLLQHGIFYFGVMFATNVVAAIPITSSPIDLVNITALFDYVMVSHFLLDLQDISNETIDDLDSSQHSFIRSDQGQISSIRFADAIVSSFGAPLRDGTCDENMDEDESDMPITSNAEIGDEETPVHVPQSSVNVQEDATAGPSRIPASVPFNDNAFGRTGSSDMPT